MSILPNGPGAGGGPAGEYARTHDVRDAPLMKNGQCLGIFANPILAAQTKRFLAGKLEEAKKP